MPTESLDEVTGTLRLAIAADDLMVPFRPQSKTPKGQRYHPKSLYIS